MATHTWVFRARLRRNAFGWKGSRQAIERLSEAVAEIERVARVDPVLAGEGAVLLLEKLSPAVSDVDGSSGALSNAAAGVVERMVPLIAAAPVPRPVRQKWLDHLLAAIEEDDPPYIESLGEHWGTLCGDPACASQWADQLLPLVHRVMADRRKGTSADVTAACDHAVAAADILGEGALVPGRIADSVAGTGPAAVWVRKCLGIGVAA